MNKKIILLPFILFINCNAETITYSDLVASGNTPISEVSENRENIINNCNQNFNNVKIGGNVVMNCITTIQRVSVKEKEKIKSLSNNIFDINNNINNLKNSKNLNDRKIQRKIRNNKIKITELRQKYIYHKENILSIESALNNIKNSTQIRNKVISDKIFLIEKINIKSIKDIKNIGILVEKNTNTIIILEGRVDLIENDLSYLMNEYTDGNLKSISFYGPKLGMANFNDSTYSVIGFEYERLFNPKNKLSWFIDISRYDGEKKSTYATLNGLDNQIINEDNSFYSLSLGSRIFIKEIYDFNFYGGGSLGYTLGDETTLFTNLFLGTEFYKKYNKLSLELGYIYFNDLKQRQVIFNPLGQSEDFETKDNDYGISLSLKYSTR